MPVLVSILICVFFLINITEGFTDDKEIHAVIISTQKRISESGFDKFIIKFKIQNNSSFNIIIPFSDYRIGNCSGYLLDSNDKRIQDKYIDRLASKETDLMPEQVLLRPGESCVLGSWIYDLKLNMADGLNCSWKNLKNLRGTDIKLHVIYSNPKAKTNDCNNRNRKDRIFRNQQIQ